MAENYSLSVKHQSLTHSLLEEHVFKMVKIQTGIQCKHRKKKLSGKESSAIAVVEKKSNQISII